MRRTSRLTVVILALIVDGLFILAWTPLKQKWMESYDLHQLETGDERSKRNAAERLADMKSLQAIRPLIEILRNEAGPPTVVVCGRETGKCTVGDVPVLHYSIDSLKRIGRLAVAPLVEILEEEYNARNAVAKSAAACVLGQIGPPASDAVPVLQLIVDRWKPNGGYQAGSSADGRRRRIYRRPGGRGELNLMLYDAAKQALRRIRSGDSER